MYQLHDISQPVFNKSLLARLTNFLKLPLHTQKGNSPCETNRNICQIYIRALQWYNFLFLGCFLTTNFFFANICFPQSTKIFYLYLSCCCCFLSKFKQSCPIIQLQKLMSKEVDGFQHARAPVFLMPSWEMKKFSFVIRNSSRRPNSWWGCFPIDTSGDRADSRL